MFKINNRNTRKRCKIRLKLTIKTPERRRLRPSGLFIVNFGYISQLFLVFLLSTLSIYLFSVFMSILDSEEEHWGNTDKTSNVDKEVSKRLKASDLKLV